MNGSAKPNGQPDWGIIEGLLSIRECAKRGINKIRLDIWSNPDDYMEFDIIDGEPGPWFRLYSPVNKAIGQDDPQTVLCTMMGDMDKAQWRPLPRTLMRNDAATIDNPVREAK